MPVCVHGTQECQVYQCVPSTGISRRFESRLWALLPPCPILLPFRTDGPQDMVWRHYTIARLLFANSQYRSTHFFACPSMSLDHEVTFAPFFSDSSNFSVVPAKIRDSNISSVFVSHSCVGFTFALSASQVHVIKKRCGLSPDQCVYPISSTWDRDVASFQTR